VAAAQSVFSNRLLSTLAEIAPGIDPAKVLITGASEINKVFSAEELVHVRAAYMVGIKDVFAFSMAGAALTVLLALIIPFKSLPSHEATEKTDAGVTAAL
jgi:hypothetical protein